MNYLKADLFKIVKERKLVLSLTILLFLSLLATSLLSDDNAASYTTSFVQLMSQFLMLFFIVPANIFFGEDFSHRTINNVIIKQQTRNLIFYYKICTALIFDLLYVLLAYSSGILWGALLGKSVAVPLLFQIFLHQLPLLLAIGLLSLFLFIALNKVTQSYLAYILIALLFDNTTHLITKNILHMDLSSDYFLFLSLQSGENISSHTTLISLIFILIYFSLSWYLFNHRELK